MAFDPDEWEIDPTPLGEGYFAQVFRATTRDDYLQAQRGAFKILKGDLDDGHARRFFGEMKVLSGIRGIPYLTNVLGAGRFRTGPWAGRLFIAMELADGSLADMARGWSWPDHRVDILEAGVQVATGLAGLHGAGILHGDLKPDNVLYAARAWKLADFNVSSALVDGASAYYGATLSILPPESNPLDGRQTTDDVWALGVLLTQLTTGRHPFAFADDVRSATVEFGRGGRGPELDAVPADVRPIVQRCLAASPAARPTAQQAADDLMRLLLDARSAGGEVTLPLASATLPHPEIDASRWHVTGVATSPDTVEMFIRTATSVQWHQAGEEGWASRTDTSDSSLMGPSASALTSDLQGYTFEFPIVDGPMLEVNERLLKDRTSHGVSWTSGDGPCVALDPFVLLDGELFDDHGVDWGAWRTPITHVVAATATTADRGHQEVFTLSTNGSVHHSWRVEGPQNVRGDWVDWTQMPTPEGAHLVRIGTVADHGGHMELLAVDAEGQVWHRRLHHRWLHGGSWSDWALLDLTVPGARAITGTSAARGHIEVFVLDGEGRPHHRWWWEHEGWSDWVAMSRPEPLVDLVAVAAYRLPMVLCAIGESGTIWWRSLHGDWEWSDWSQDLPPL